MTYVCIFIVTSMTTFNYFTIFFFSFYSQKVSHLQDNGDDKFSLFGLWNFHLICNKSSTSKVCCWFHLWTELGLPLLQMSNVRIILQMNYDANKMQELIFFVVDNFSGMANAPIIHLHRYVASVTYPFPHIFPRSVVLSIVLRHSHLQHVRIYRPLNLVHLSTIHWWNVWNVCISKQPSMAL